MNESYCRVAGLCHDFSSLSVFVLNLSLNLFIIIISVCVNRQFSENIEF
jgi:hypothetical protein